MELPWHCSVCRAECMVDFGNLLQWPLDGLITAHGFICSCGAREAVSYSTPSLREAERKLNRYSPNQPQYRHLFAKLLRKAEGVNRRGALLHGAIERPHMAESGPLG